ncbi:MAG TPA: carboxypeptidase regulatory-like domain-containing protein, partial [Terriglobales bacterium]|nr:carboxypeptidase regulatory-like domain-containing protein [Terriglobales bacterium]
MTFRFTKVCVLLLCSVFAVQAFAQNSNSTIKGTVEDASGAVVPGATVDLTNVGTNQTLSTTAKGDGFYVFTNLSPANYKVSVTAQGFAQWVGVLTLRVSQDAEISPKLTAASVSTQVTVRDVTPVIDRVNPTISDVKNATTIETIPVVNRNILNVLAFSPGVVANNVGGSGGGFTRVNGIPGGSIDYLVDGQTMANRFSNELQANPQPLPTFQEVKIITSNGDAQYARPGVVELVTKSGTNHFHGQLFELNKNNILQAKTFNSGPSIPYLMHNEFGGQVGGPVWLPKIYNGRDKTFFFVDLEGIRENGNDVVQYVVPTAAMRGVGTPNGQADLSTLVDTSGNPITIYDPNSTTYVPATNSYSRTAFAGNMIPANRLNPVSMKIFQNPANSYGIPEPNIDNGNAFMTEGSPNLIPPNAAETIRNKLYTGKVDQLFGPNRLAMRYTYTSSTLLSPYYLLNPEDRASGGHNGAIVYTQVLGAHAVNVVRAGVQYNHNFGGPQPISPPITQTLGLPTYQDTIAWPSFYYNYGNGTYQPSDYLWSGIDRPNPKDYPDSTITGGDQFSYNRGNHQMMFGFEVDNSRLTTIETGQPGGSYNFSGGFTALQDPVAAAAGTPGVAVPDTGSGLADFLLGNSAQIQQNLYPHYHTRQTEYSGYAQDNWRATPRLTLNLGLRYTYWTPFTDASGLQSTFDPNVAGGNGIVVYQGKGPLPAYTSPAVLKSFVDAGLPIESAAQAGYPLGLFNMPKNDWQPRLGFAYQLDSRTVLRGGWGIYKWAMPLVQYQQATRKNPPFSYTSILSAGEVNGAIIDNAAATLEFPIADPQFGGPKPLDFYQLGSPTLVLNTSNVSISRGNGFAIAPFNVNYKPQTVQEYNLSLARQLPHEIGFQLSYIGNRSTNLPQEDPINYEIPRELCTIPGCTDAQRRQFPLFAESGSTAMSNFDYTGHANTNELQATLQHTFGNGLLLQSYFTWQRTLTTTESSNLANIGANAIIAPAALTNNAPYAQRQRVLYAPDSFLPTKTFSFNAHYEFPFGKGKRYLGNAHGVVNALVSGYNISPFFLWHSGFYFSPYFTTLASGTVNGGRAINLAPGKTGILPESQRNTQHWFDASIYDPNNIKCGGGPCPYAGETYIEGSNLDGDFRNNIPRNYM